MKVSLLFISVSFLLMGCQSMRTQKNTSASTNPKFSTSNAKDEMRSNPLSRQSLFEELTGQKVIAKTAPAKILQFAREARYDKNYALAIKRYNTLIKKYPRSQEVQSAYFDKSAMYAEMGLKDQSQYNLRLAQNFRAKTARPVVRMRVPQNYMAQKVQLKKTQSKNTATVDQKVNR